MSVALAGAKRRAKPMMSVSGLSMDSMCLRSSEGRRYFWINSGMRRRSSSSRASFWCMRAARVGLIGDLVHLVPHASAWRGLHPARTSTGAAARSSSCPHTRAHECRWSHALWGFRPRAGSSTCCSTCGAKQRRADGSRRWPSTSAAGPALSFQRHCCCRPRFQISCTNCCHDMPRLAAMLPK